MKNVFSTTWPLPTFTTFYFLRFALPLVGIILVITCVFLALGTALS